MPAPIAIVTATLSWPRMQGCFESWIINAGQSLDVYIVGQGGQREMPWDDSPIGPDNVRGHFYGTKQILGVVPAYAIGVNRALECGNPIIACLHDDLEIREADWATQVINLFRACPRAGLIGFGGAKGLGDADIYQKPYDPHQLARVGFRSNMEHAEAHGVRSGVAEPVACLDGFSQIGLHSFWRGRVRRGSDIVTPPDYKAENPFDVMQSWGVIHHFYDGMLGCFAKRLDYQVWYLPVACHHYGGRTAVGDHRYQEWANKQPVVRDQRGHMAAGDQGFWLKAHEIGYREFRDVLPIRT